MLVSARQREGSNLQRTRCGSMVREGPVVTAKRPSSSFEDSAVEPDCAGSTTGEQSEIENLAGRGQALGIWVSCGFANMAERVVSDAARVALRC